MSERWVEKYKPQSLDEVVGQGKQVKELRKWFENWKKGSKPVLLFGRSGNGKTASIHALAKDKGLDLIEVNASDSRNKKDLRKILGETVKQKSLLKKGKIILIDEVDGLSGRQDRGGISELNKILKESEFPIALTANDPYSQKLRGLKRKSKTIKFGKVNLRSMAKRLKTICEKEGIEADKKLLKRMARQNSGDLRSTINDLEGLAQGRKKIEAEDLASIGIRERQQNIFEVLKVIFKTKTPKTAIDMMNKVDKTPDEVFWWIEENIPNEYENNKEIAAAYEYLARADLFRQRIRRHQKWGLLKYMIDLMCGGVAISKKEKYRKFTRYKPPGRFIRYGRSKKHRKELDELSKKIGERVHASSKVVKRDYLPLLQVIFENREDWKENIVNEVRLSEKEVSEIE